MPGAAEGGQCFDPESFENAKQMDELPQPKSSGPVNVGSAVPGNMRSARA